MPETGGKTPGRGQGRWARYSKTASFWIILALIPIVMYRLFQPQRDQATELTYSEFSLALDRGVVQKVTIVDGQRVEGTLRAPVGKDGRNYNQFWIADREFDNRTSLITDPADGRLPPLTPGAIRRSRVAAAVAQRDVSIRWPRKTQLRPVVQTASEASCSWL